jgi:hypothetical protein
MKTLTIKKNELLSELYFCSEKHKSLKKLISLSKVNFETE